MYEIGTLLKFSKLIGGLDSYWKAQEHFDEDFVVKHKKHMVIFWKEVLSNHMTTTWI